MKIIILGAGGIGSVVGALLSKENEVLLVGRKAHVDKINKDGLEIEGAVNGNFKVKAAEKIEDIEGGALVILTTKAVGIEKSINDIKNLIKDDTVILSLQNGLGTEDLIKSIVNCRVIRGIITTGTAFLEAGMVTCSNIGSIYLEESGVSEKIRDVLLKAGFDAEISKNIKERIWMKVIFNCVLNPLTAIFKVKNSEISKAPGLARQIINEAVLVAEKEGLKFDSGEVLNMAMDIMQKSAANKSSMFQDILKGRKTEIDFLNGRIAELGNKHNVKTPVNDVLVSMVKFLEKQ